VLGLEHYALKCPNKIIMVTRDNRDMQFKSDRSDCEDKPPLKDCTNKEVA